MKTVLLTLASALILSMGLQSIFQVNLQHAAATQQAVSYQQPTPPPGGLAEVRLHASDYQAYDYFGYSVAIDGNLVAVGAPGVDQTGKESGAIYVFQYGDQGWSETAKLAPDSLGPRDQLGTAVALDGETLAAGAAYATTREAGFAAGVVYIFVRQGNNWRQQARLTAQDSGTFDLFGSAIALDGDTLVVGARAADGPSRARNSGAAYVFHRNGDAWVEEARLKASDGQADDFFGQSVALKGDLVAVGAFGHDNPQVGPNAGAVYVFQRSNGAWSAQSELHSARARPKAQFGYSLDFAGSAESTWLAVGSNQYSNQPIDPRYTGAPGRLELFQWQNQAWQPGEPGRLVAQFEPEIDVNAEIGLLGSSLAMEQLNDGQLVVATGGLQFTRLNLFQVPNLPQVSVGSFEPSQVIEPEQLQLNFGSSLAMSANWLVAGSRWDSEMPPEGQTSGSVTSSGAVYVYNLNGLK